ncbi:MAG TPA: hypothetical protein EYH19_03765, partial [Desulfocapsa sulfexigens]|nr:hypothetical protein [Desulfocapsa sulfexigens]
MNKSSFALLLILPTILCLTKPAQARLNTLTGGITTGYDYNETNYKESDTDETIPTENSHLNKLSIGPLFIFETSSSIDQITISYNPSYTYDVEESHNDVDHSFSLSGYRNFSKNLRFDINDRFIYSDDPNLIETDNSSDFNKERKRYWKNTFNINSGYTYDTKSSFGGGYSYDILRNEDTGPGGYEDYDKHIADLFLQHRINASWNIHAA